MTRQYIGARYVPKFDGAWNTNKNYESLVIVEYNDSSYITKKPTPAGTLPTNTEYYALAGTTSGQIRDLQERMTNAEENIEALENDIENLSIINDNFINRKFLLLADSYGMRETSKPTWTELFTSRYTNSRHKSVSSRGFAVSNNSFLMGITDFNNELSEVEKKSITDIVVCGGWNDSRWLTEGGTDNELQSKIFEFVDYCNDHFPNATPWIGFIGWQTHDKTQEGTNLSDLIRTEKIYNYTAYKNLKILNGVSDIMKDSNNMDVTYFHPNPTGSIQLFFGISRALYGGYTYHALHSDPNTFVFDNGVSGTVTNFDVSISGGIAKISMLLTGVTSTAVKIGTFALRSLPYGHMSSIRFNAKAFNSNYRNGRDIYSILNKNRDLEIYDDLNNENVLIQITLDTLSEI